MKRAALFTLLIGLLLSLSGIRALALSPLQATHTVTLTSDQEVAVGYHNQLNEKVAYGSAEDRLRLGNYIAPNPQPGDARFRTYIHFDLSGIPAGATIQQATLSMYVFHQRFPGGGGLNTGAYRVNAGWTEAGLQNTANWSWATLPAFQSTPESAVNLSSLNQWYSWDVTALAQAWGNATLPNYGLMLCESPLGGANQGFGARSRAGAAPALAPHLTVTYVGTAPATPTPRPVQIEPAITKWVTPGQALPGEQVTYTIQATNRGRDAPIDVIITDVMPDHLEVLTATTTQGTVAITGQTVSASVGVIGQNFVVEVVVHARVRPDVPAPLQIVNIAHFRSPNGGEHKTPPTVLNVLEPTAAAVPDPLLPISGGLESPGSALLFLGGGLIALAAAMYVLKRTAH